VGCYADSIAAFVILALIHINTVSRLERIKMARPEEHKLYRELIDSRFSFVTRGTRHIDEIYTSVSSKYPDLCDNDYYCSENCTAGNNQPEWNHTVRNALQRLKSPMGPVSFTGKKGYWEFR